MRLYGRNPVLERIKSAPQSIHKIYVQEEHPEAGYIFQKAKKYAIPVVVVPATKLLKLAQNVNTQGLVADVEEFAYVTLPDLLESDARPQRVLVFIDELNDPQNLGAMLRSMACLGNFAVILPTHNSVQVTQTVLRVASGGENYVPVVRVKNLTQAILRAKEAGFWVIGAVVKDGQDIRETTLSFPLALVVGSEQKGIRDAVQQHLDLKVTIPMAQPRMAMNAAHAATVFCYEIMRQVSRSS